MLCHLKTGGSKRGSSASVSCTGHLNEAISTRQFGSVKPQGRVRGVLSIAMADLLFILGKMGVSKCGKTNVLSLGL